MRFPLFAFAIVCLALTGQTTNAYAVHHKQEIKKDTANDPARKRRDQKAEQSGTKGFGSICIGCGAQ